MSGKKLPENNFEKNRLWGSELRVILLPLLRWWWALITVPLISGFIAYILVKNGPTYYQGRMLLNIGPPLNELQERVPSLITIRLGASYSQIIKQDSFMNLVSQKSGTAVPPDEISSSTVVFFTAGTPFFEVMYVDRNPERVIRILDTISKLLVEETPQIKEMKRKSYLDFIAVRRADLLEEINKLNSEIKDLDGQKLSRGEVDEVNSKIDYNITLVKAKISEYEQEIVELGSFTSQNDANQIFVIDKPHLVSLKLGVQPNGAAMAMGALSLALLVIFIYFSELLDKKVKNRHQLETLTGWKTWNQPLKRLNKQKDENYELLAAELAAGYAEHGGYGIYRVLIIHEQNTKGVPEAMIALARMISLFGYNINISKGYTQKYAGSHAANISEPDVMENVSPQTVFGEVLENKQETALQIANLDWEIISQQWPASAAQLSMLSLDCDVILVLCSLKRAGKKEMQELARFYQATPFKIKGLLLV